MNSLVTQARELLLPEALKAFHRKMDDIKAGCNLLERPVVEHVRGHLEPEIPDAIDQAIVAALKAIGLNPDK